MKKRLLFILLFSSLYACKSTKIGATKNVQLRYLDDYVIPKDTELDGTIVGGLSDIAFHDGKIFLVSDQPSHPRIYIADLRISGEQIDSVVPKKVITIDQEVPELKNQHLDLEGLVVSSETGEFLISSEGAISKGKDPMIFRVSQEGEFLGALEIPENFSAESSKKPRNNGTFEGLTHSFDRNGFWMAMELPLKTDGPKPKLIRTKSPVRITYFDKKTGRPTRQFPYLLEPIAKIPWLYFAVNGVTDLLEYAPDRFLILERGFSSGHGSNGNTVRIFDVNADLGTNILKRNNLGVTFYNPARKELVFDFKWVRKYLSDAIIDNIEGLAFGPTLPNGNRTLLLVADNNFNALGPQINQVILMEIKIK